MYPGLSDIISLLIFFGLIAAIAAIYSRRKYGKKKRTKQVQHLPTGSSPSPPASPKTKKKALKRDPQEEPAVSKTPPRKPVRKREPGAPANNIFVSYRRDDSADVTGRICDRLATHFGRERIFMDVDSIPLGFDFRTYLDRIVSDCDVFIAVIGEDWLGVRETGPTARMDDPRDFVRIEVESALARDIPVIPALVRGAAIPTEQQLPQSVRSLAYRNGIAIRPDPDFHNDMDRLIRGLEALLSEGEE